jgi:hypothetical protein
MVLSTHTSELFNSETATEVAHRERAGLQKHDHRRP